METGLEEKIIGIIEKELHINFADAVNPQYSLLDPRNGLQPRDLLVVFLALQRELDFTFEDGDILEHRFDFIPEMVEAVRNHQKYGQSAGNRVGRA